MNELLSSHVILLIVHNDKLFQILLNVQVSLYMNEVLFCKSQRDEDSSLVLTSIPLLQKELLLYGMNLVHIFDNVLMFYIGLHLLCVESLLVDNHSLFELSSKNFPIFDEVLFLLVTTKAILVLRFEKKQIILILYQVFYGLFSLLLPIMLNIHLILSF